VVGGGVDEVGGGGVYVHLSHTRGGRGPMAKKNKTENRARWLGLFWGVLWQNGGARG